MGRGQKTKESNGKMCSESRRGTIWEGKEDQLQRAKEE